jgi:phosphoribosylformimino-5-aminoimidazole carboxamide ribotide isomerase
MQTDLISQVIAGSGLKVEVGGGVRCTADIQNLLNAGAERIVVGTKALEDWNWFRALAHDAEFDSKLVLALDAKEGQIATRGWTQTSTRTAVDVAAEVSDWPLGAILYTDVSKDGMLQGPNLIYTNALAKAGKVPVIASGGVGSLDHIEQLRKLPIWGAIVGRSLYEGTLDLRSAIQRAQG